MSPASWSIDGRRGWLWAGFGLVFCLGMGRSLLLGQGTVGEEGEKPIAPVQQVIVRREAVQLLPPDGYRVRLALEAAKAVDLVAPTDGVVRVISGRQGEAVREKTEVIRLDDSRPQLLVRRAKARLKAAQAEKQQANGNQVAIADARVEEAESEVALATYDAEQAVIRTPFGGTLERLLVVEGEFVKAGQKLARVVDATHLSVEAPVDRSTVQVGGQMEILVEGTAVQAKVVALLPLADRFAAVSQLVESPALALLLIENGVGKLRAGQTVQSLLLPRDPITAVSAAAVVNQPDGTRRIQVLRQGVVRNLPVQIHGRAGGEAVYVSGRFGATDEVIVATTRELADGTPLRALTTAETAAGAKPGAEPGKKKKPTTTNSGF